LPDINLSKQSMDSSETTDPRFKSPETIFEDSISCLHWYHSRVISTTSALAVSSWDSKVRIFHVTPSFGLYPPAVIEITSLSTEYPCLGLAFLASPEDLAFGSIDGTLAHMRTSNGRIIQTFGKHDAAVQGLHQVNDSQPLLCSTSYDGKTKFWDLRTGGTSPTFELDLAEKIVCSDVAGSQMVVGLANEKIHIFDIRHAFQTRSAGPQIDTTLGVNSPLSDISISKDGNIGIGSYSGRSAISKFKPSPDGNFTLETPFCFRAQKLDSGQGGNNTGRTIMYPVNAVGHHPINPDIYLTAGRDGVVNFWKISQKKRILNFTWKGVPITKAKWSPDGRHLAYGVGYDWSKGIEGAKSFKTKLCVHLFDPALV